MPASFTQASDIGNSPSKTLTKSGRPRRAKRMGPDGKMMRRLTLLLSDTDYNNVMTSINYRLGPLFVKAFGGAKILAVGDEAEFRGQALGAICEDWQIDVERESEN